MKKRYFYIVGIVAAAVIAAAGNIPYGYRFAGVLFPTIKFYYVTLGIIFAGVSALANAALGTYSLLNMYKEKTDFQKDALSISVVGAIPMGFICFFGYRELIPLPLNVVTSCIVTIVNGAIGYVAITSLIEKTKQLKKWFNNFRSLLNKLTEVMVKAIGFSLGLCMSLVGYIASANGMQLLFNHSGWSGNLVTKLIYIIAVLTWIPFAALYANSTQTVFGEAYQHAIKIKKAWQDRRRRIPFSWLSVGLIFFSLLSGTALTQITLELFSPSNNIPLLFKQTNMQMFIHYFLLPITFISVSAVNYLALTKLLQNLQKEKKQKK